MPVRYTPLGRTDTIGASCHFLDIHGTGVALDAGLDPEEDGPASTPDFRIVKREADWYIDHVLITHAHHDHLGGLPVLFREFPHALAHMTPATRQLADVLLPASARLQRRRMREGSSAYDPLFDEDDVELHSYLYLTHDPGDPFDITGLNGRTTVTAQFFDAGHILGSAGVLLTYADEGTERRLFYTGDTNPNAQTIIPGGTYPEPPIDTLLLESTLGADPEAEQTTRREEERKLRDAVVRVLERGGNVVIPVFAIGRAQEILALIDRYKQRGDIDADVPVYTAGLQRAISDIYDKTRTDTPRLNNDFRVYGVDQERVPRSSQGKRRGLHEPSIYVVTSGMMFEGTLSNWFAQRIVEDEDSGVILVGFSKEGSPADRLLSAAESEEEEMHVVLDELVGPQQLRCEVQRLRFSGHGTRRDLLDIVGALKPARVVLVHGDADARTWMADNLAHFYPDVEVTNSETGKTLTL